MSSPLQLSDSEITTIMQLARPLTPSDRTRFLELLASRLDGQRDLGDGGVYRLCRELQKQFFSTRDFDTAVDRRRRGNRNIVTLRY